MPLNYSNSLLGTKWTFLVTSPLVFLHKTKSRNIIAFYPACVHKCNLTVCLKKIEAHFHRSRTQNIRGINEHFRLHNYCQIHVRANTLSLSHKHGNMKTVPSARQSKTYFHCCRVAATLLARLLGQSLNTLKRWHAGIQIALWIYSPSCLARVIWHQLSNKTHVQYTLSLKPIKCWRRSAVHLISQHNANMCYQTNFLTSTFFLT